MKRGGGLTKLSFDFSDGEVRYADSLIDEETPERIFEKQWALTLLQRVFDQLGAEYAIKSKGDLFEQCRRFLVNSTAEISYTETAKSLNMSEGALRVAVHRLRERYRELLRAEIAGTIADDAAIEDELMHLRRAIGGED